MHACMHAQRMLRFSIPVILFRYFFILISSFFMHWRSEILGSFQFVDLGDYFLNITLYLLCWCNVLR
jgi:hypothetical protein